MKNGTGLALAALGALAGVAALGRRGSRASPSIMLTFEVNPLVDLESTLIPPALFEANRDVEVAWDGNPSTFPTRAQVLEEFRRQQEENEPFDDADTVESAGVSASRSSLWFALRVLRASDAYTLVPRASAQWKVRPRGFSVRTMLGGRLVVVRDGKVVGHVDPARDWLR